MSHFVGGKLLLQSVKGVLCQRAAHAAAMEQDKARIVQSTRRDTGNSQQRWLGATNC